MPTIPHGAQISTTDRMTILPWFVGLQADLQNLEISDGGTWADLQRAHIGLVAAKSSPSGLNPMYGTIPGRFPAAVALNGLGALSSALICKEIWDSPAVLAERDLLLTGDFNDIEKHIAKWRKHAISHYLSASELVEAEERRCYGPRSFFNLFDEHGLPLPSLQPDYCDASPSDESFTFAEDFTPIQNQDPASESHL